jgi:hypothetical protein
MQDGTRGVIDVKEARANRDAIRAEPRRERDTQANAPVPVRHETGPVHHAVAHLPPTYRIGLDIEDTAIAYER